MDPRWFVVRESRNQLGFGYHAFTQMGNLCCCYSAGRVAGIICTDEPLGCATFICTNPALEVDLAAIGSGNWGVCSVVWPVSVSDFANADPPVGVYRVIWGIINDAFDGSANAA